jgi:L-iditol 2-dehydrogenase
MKALVKYARGPGQMEVRQVAEKQLAAGEVRIAVEAAGICGSDIHIFHDEIGIPLRVPVVLGHEFSGRVVEVGEAVSDWTPGMRVTAMPSVRICGTCRYCRREEYNLCLGRESMGYWHDGAFAPTCVVPARCLWALPENVDFRAGALCEPLACAVHAVSELTGVTAADQVAIVGPGAIGLLCLQVVLAEGGSAVVCGLKRDGQRLELARRLGAWRAVGADEEDAAAAVRGMTGGYGADVVLECSGSAAGAALALELVRKRGKYTQVGLFGRPIQFDLEKVAFKELVFTGSLGQKPSSWQRALRLMAAARVDAGALITHQLPLEEWREGFALFERQEGVKILLDVKT